MPPTTPLVSVIIPVFNGQAYLAEALASVSRQSMSQLEIVVIDDGSTDETTRVLQEFGDSRLRHAHQEQAGAATARNRGVQEARGRYLAFLDADDLWSADKLQLQLADLERDGGMSFTLVDEFISPDCAKALGASAQPRLGLGGGVTTLLVARADFARVGPFDPQCRLGEFIEWRARATDLGLRSGTVPLPLTQRRLHLANMTRARRPEAHLYAATLRRVLERRRAAP